MTDSNYKNFPGDWATKPHLEKFSRPFLTIDCGHWSYGRPTVTLANTDTPRTLRIGRYCSIGSGVNIYVGRQGIHPTDTLTTFPLQLAVPANELKSDVGLRYPELRASRTTLPHVLDTIIGHDVWIGDDVTIHAGVTIGTGAVIGTCALVTSDVPPYAIVGGVPAKLIRYRHPETLIASLLASQWWELEPSDIWSRIGSLLSSADVGGTLRLLTELSQQEEKS